MKHRSMCVLLGVVALAGGCVSDDESTTSAAAPLQVGTLVAPASRPWAAFVVAAVPGGTLNCSGALIAPNLVLTAARCTVCASSISVGLMGESTLPGAPPLVLHGNAAGGITTHPQAFKTPVTCAGDPTAIALDVNDKQVDGRALGLVRLASNVGVAPVNVLLQPPPGFSPVQDLHGAQKLTVVSGGSDALVFGTHAMREAKFALERYSNQLLLPDCDPGATEPFTLQREMEANVGALDGDQGGAWLAKVNGSERIIGIAAVSTMGLFDSAAATFQIGNAEFIRSGLGNGITYADGDGDDVADIVDNCPLDANRDQIDRDADGVGDVCDNCAPHQGNGMFFPGPLDSFDPADGPWPQYANPSQANCNADAEDQAILAEDPSLAAGGGVKHLDDDDYMASFGGAIFSTCQASPLNRITKHRRGDACDPIPCAKTSPRTTSIPPQDFGPLAQLCGANGYAIATCSFEAISGWHLEGTGNMSATSGQDGLRLCRCTMPHGSAAERRLFCAASPAGCAIDPALYQLDHPKWKKLDLVGAGPDGEKLTTLSFPGGGANVDWNYMADLTALTGTAMPPPPWTLNSDGTIAGGPKLKGVLWSHVVTYGGQPTAGIAPIDHRGVAALASNYESGDHRFARKVHWHKIPRYKPAYWWEYCAMCGVELTQKWLEVVQDRTGGVIGVVAVGPDGGTDVTGLVDQTAVSLLTAGTHVNASEPEATLALAGVSSRAVVLRAGTIEVIGKLGAGQLAGGQVAQARGLSGGGSRGLPGGGSSGLPSGTSGELSGARTMPAASLADGEGGGAGVVGEAFAPVAQPIETGEAVAVAYAATRGELFALRQPRDKAVALRSFSLATRRWQTLRLSGARLSTPLAATYAPADQSLYVLDRGTGSAVRLVRVSLDDGVATIVSAALLDGSYSALSLSLTGAATLLVVAADARAGETRAAHLQLPGEPNEPNDVERLMLLDRAIFGREQMAGGALENAAGVLFLVATGDAFEPRLLRRDAFRPVNEPVTGPVL